MATKRTTTRRTVKKPAFHRAMYPGVPFCERCFVHHEGSCPRYTATSAYRCPCEFRQIAGLCCVPGAAHPSRAKAA